MKRLLLLPLLVAGLLSAQAIERPEALAQGKQLVLTTSQGRTYHYVVSALDSPMLCRQGDRLVVQGDTFLLADVSSLRFRKMPHYVLSEDSTAFGAYAVDHGLLAFCRTLATGQWNSLTVPFSLTGRQVRQAFGQDARLAVVSKMRQAGEAAIEFATVSLDGNQVALQAGSHYLLWPTRQPDVPQGQRLPSQWTADRAEGPLYLLPTVALDGKQAAPATRNFYGGTDGHVFVNGTYYRLDGTLRQGNTVRNKKVAPGAYVFGDDGLAVQHTDSVLLQGFRSWFIDLSRTEAPLHFYVDGVSDDLLATAAIGTVQRQQGQRPAAVFDLQGRRVSARQGALRKGIYIIDGRKQIVK